MSIERTVAILTPVFAAVAGLLSALVAKVIPGVNIPAGEITAVFITGSTAAATAALTWLHHRAQFVLAEKSAASVEAKVRAQIAASPQAALAVGDVENLLKTHTAQIEAAIDQHVPVAVGQALKVAFGQIGAAAGPGPFDQAVPPVTGP